MPREINIRSEEEVREALLPWLEMVSEDYDEAFGMLAFSEMPERFLHCLGPPATSRGYHGGMQGTPWFLLALLFTDRKLDQVPKIIERILETQVTDKNSESYGAFRHIYEALEHHVVDTNGSFFVCMGLIPIVKEFSDKLDPSLVKRLKAAMARTLPAAYERQLGVSYTNAALGNIAVQLVIADMIGDPEAFEICRRHFDHFYQVNMDRGIPERLSGYYAVDFMVLGLVLTYVQDAAVCWRARELLSVLAQELLFFDNRLPIPSRRTNNQNEPSALQRSIFFWLIGSGDFHQEQANGTMLISYLALRHCFDAQQYLVPAPKQMRGKFVDDLGYTSYVHRDFTIGTFDRWISPTMRKQHESDIPVGFAGTGEDFVCFGAYSIDGEDNVQCHPGTGKVGMPSKAGLPVLSYLACQHANVCLLLTNIRGLATEQKEIGWRLSGLHWHGKLFSSDGEPLSGKGTVDANWVFLQTEAYYAGVYPLTHFDPARPGDYLQATPTPLDYETRENGLTLCAPIFKEDSPFEITGDNLPAGAIIVLGSARDGELDAFRSGCLRAGIIDDWYIDGYITRRGYQDCERRTGIDMPGLQLRLGYDYQYDQVTARTVNGRAIETPQELSTIRLGVVPVLP